MAKKTRRPNLPQETLERARREMARTGGMIETSPAPSATSEIAAAPKPRRVILQTADLRTEYAYVANDLRTVAMLAAGLLIVLVVLSFII